MRYNVIFSFQDQITYIFIKFLLSSLMLYNIFYGIKYFSNLKLIMLKLHFPLYFMYPKGKYYIFDEKIKTYIYYIEFLKNHFLLLYTTG